MTSTDRTVLVTGANGALGSLLCRRLAASGWQVRSLARTAGANDVPGTIIGSVTDPDAVAAACDGVQGIVHLAGISVPGHPWKEYLENNIDGTRTVLEEARRAGVARVALASSNHAVGYLSRSAEPLAADLPPRPDSFYGVSKAAVEALGSFYADEHGIKTTSLRIGSCFPRPTTTRMLSTWLSEDDLMRLVEASLTGPWFGHSTVWGISRNTRRWWSLDAGERIGYVPVDDSEVFAAEVPAGADEDEASRYVGGSSPAFG